MGKTIKHFLLVFDHDLNRLVELHEFGDDRKPAVAGYEDRERQDIGQLRRHSALEAGHSPSRPRRPRSTNLSS